MAIFDDICEFDDSQVCKRHNIKHEGRHYNISQDKSSIGHSYRKQWDADYAGNVNFEDVCEIGEDGICKRHKTKHEGQNLAWSRDKTIIGWSCRKHWDKLLNNPEPVKKDCGCGKPKGNLR